MSEDEVDDDDVPLQVDHIVEEEEDDDANGAAQHHHALLSTNVCMKFDSGWYQGTVRRIDWIDNVIHFFVVFEDGDTAHYSEPEITQNLLTDQTLRWAEERRANEKKESQQYRHPTNTSERPLPGSTVIATSSSSSLSVMDGEHKVASESRNRRRRISPASSSEPPPDSDSKTDDEEDITRNCRRRRRKAVCYADQGSDDDEDEALQPQAKKRSKKTPPLDHDSDATMDMADDDDDDDDQLLEDLVNDHEVSSIDDDNDDESSEHSNDARQDKTKTTKTYNKTNTKKTRPNKGKGKAVVETDGKTATGKKKMHESFEPINVPNFKHLSLEEIHHQKEYLDPCGMEGTDDIIDGIVGEQVDKIGRLLQAVLAESSAAIGSKTTPLRLGTACSGTDAPALAMTMVQEQIEKRRWNNNTNKNMSFHYEHIFSCEVDPFKQAYLARNFDSILYPDICKLTDDTPPRDVFGQEQAIPPFNVFVAGTSCKNFSMQNSTRRMDIEDKGCSGETFLAAVEVLFQEKPLISIFENVIGAPWVRTSIAKSNVAPLWSSTISHVY
jgi:C-5 cytosine-specific DNA methylase